MNIIIANYGNDSLALIQWAFENQLAKVYVVNVDTGWSAPKWPAHVSRCQNWVESLGMQAISLKPRLDFASLIKQKGQFPSQKFQWCATSLKAAPILTWLDEEDFEGQATILLPHRRLSSISRAALPEFIEASEHYGQRKVWHPLIAMNLEQRNALVAKTGFEIAPHRSLECDPCVNSNLQDVLRLELSVLQRTSMLEKELGQRFLDVSLYHGESSLLEAQAHWPVSLAQSTVDSDIFDMGCSSPYGCGM